VHSQALKESQYSLTTRKEQHIQYNGFYRAKQISLAPSIANDSNHL